MYVVRISPENDVTLSCATDNITSFSKVKTLIMFSKFWTAFRCLYQITCTIHGRINR